MSFSIKCPSCSQPLTGEPSWVDKRIVCPRCSHGFVCLSPDSHVASAPPPLPPPTQAADLEPSDDIQSNIGDESAADTNEVNKRYLEAKRRTAKKTGFGIMIIGLLGMVVLGTVLVIMLEDDSNVNARTNYESPEEVFEAFAKAMEDQDVETVMGCMTEDLRDDTVGLWVLGASLIAEMDEDKGKTIGKLLEKHGVSKEVKKRRKSASGFDFPELGRKVKNQTAFVKDIVQAIDDENFISASFGRDIQPQLYDVEIDGDAATALFSSTVPTLGQMLSAIHFKKTDGGWLIDSTQ